MCSSFFYTIVRDNTGQAQTARFVTPALPQREPLPRRTKMAKGFTDLKIKNLKAGAVRREIPDPGASGLYLVVQPSGKKSFAVRYRYNGTPRKLTLPGGLTLKAARKLASDALYELEKGHDPAATKKETRVKLKAAKADTVQALCENYLSREAKKPEAEKLRTLGERKRELERLVYPEIGDVPLADLKRSHIVRMLDKIEDANGAKMADLTLAFVRRISTGTRRV